MMAQAPRHVRACPGCRRAIVCDDATREIRHPDPICPVFAAIMRASGMQPAHRPWAAQLGTDGTVIQFASTDATDATGATGAKKGDAS